MKKNRNDHTQTLLLALCALLITISGVTNLSSQNNAPQKKDDGATAAPPKIVRQDTEISPPDTAKTGKTIHCTNPRITDGDTLNCDNTKIRLYGIDAPEMPGSCKPGRHCVAGNPHLAKNQLKSLSRGAVTCTQVDTDHYGRTVATCTSQGIDLGCAMVESGHAVERYGTLDCP